MTSYATTSARQPMRYCSGRSVPETIQSRSWMFTGTTKHRKGPQRTAQDRKGPQKDRKGHHRTIHLFIFVWLLEKANKDQ